MQTNAKNVAVTPREAPHLSGRAITFELLDEKEGLLCNEICLNSKIFAFFCFIFVNGFISKKNLYQVNRPTALLKA